jgi:hypothetical protein
MEYTVVYSQNNQAHATRKRFERAPQKLDGILRIHDNNQVNPSKISSVSGKKPAGMVATLLQENSQSSHLEDSTEYSGSDSDTPTSKKRSRDQRHKASARSFHTPKANGLVYSGPITKVYRAIPIVPSVEENPFVVSFQEDDVVILDRWEVQIVEIRQNHSKEPYIPRKKMFQKPVPLISNLSSVGVSQIRSLQRPLQSVICRKPLRLANHIVPIRKNISAFRSKLLQNSKKTITESTTAVASDDSTIVPHIPLPGSIRTALKPHQVSGVDFLWRTLTEKQGCILGDEMGLGVRSLCIFILESLFGFILTFSFFCRKLS